MSIKRLESNLKKLENWRREGYQFVCIGCNTVYRQKPQEWYEDGHNGRFINMCRCGCDLFHTLDSVIGIMYRKISELKVKSN